jgi:Fe-S cluster biogenesis protein NfuA/nitrite reductase/ring-hydroxylating ferredoxin subunit
MKPTDRAMNRSDLTGFLDEIERLEAIFEKWDEIPRASAKAYRRAIEAINGEALRRMTNALKSDPISLAAMKRAAGDEVVYAVLRRHNIVKASLNERVENALEGVRPMLASHGGDVELVKVEPPMIEIRLIGACDGCPASALTFQAGIKKAVQQACPEITEILQVSGKMDRRNGVRYTSPFAVGADGDWVFAGTLSDIPDDGIRAAEIGGEKVILTRHGSMVACFQNACSHLGLALDDGEVAGGVITCSHHGFQYNIISGECLTAPEVRLKPHVVRVVERRVEVRLST